jgi:hypothetical protein
MERRRRVETVCGIVASYFFEVFRWMLPPSKKCASTDSVPVTEELGEFSSITHVDFQRPPLKKK